MPIIPSDLLEKCRGSKVLLILVGNSEIEGTMVEVDGSCNVLVREATSYRTLRSEKAGQKDAREKTGEFSLVLVPTSSIEMVVPGGMQVSNAIVSTIADKQLF